MKTEDENKKNYVNPDKWISTVSYEKSYVNPDKWISTVPQRNRYSFSKKYSFFIIIFIVGLISVPTIKNKTRNLEKEISNLKTSINNLKFDLHKTTLDYEFITSPENISLLAKEHLNIELAHYKKSQIKHINDDYKSISMLTETENNDLYENKISTKIKKKVEKNIKEKKQEIEKIKKLYSNPKQLPKTIKNQVAKKIKKTKSGLQQLYDEPKEAIDMKKIQKWGTFQVVKAFLGIPVVPGK